MAFWSKKKKQTPPLAPPPAPLSVFLSGGRFDRDILCTLPQGTQVLGIAAEGENFPLLQFSDEATGRYYLFADESCRPAPECEKFYKELENREEELLLFSLREKDSLPQFPQDVPSFFGQDAFPLARAGFAVRAELYERVKKIARPCRALDLLLYAESAACVPAPFCKAQPLPWSAAQVLDAVRFFHAARAQLSAEKYRYAFAFLRERITGMYAALCLAKDRPALCSFDETLRRESPALRIAAFRASPMRFLPALQKKNFEAGPISSAGTKLTLYLEKRR